MSATSSTSPTSSKSSVTFAEATCLYPGHDEPAVDRLDLTVEPGEFLVLVGPSGCGKSTSLRMLAGLEQVTSGRILIGEDDITNVEPRDRDIAMVFQNYALYPHMTVGENMAFALKIARVEKGLIQERVQEAARMLELQPYLDRKPKELSGGQRQRVAMGRAIVRQPRVFLMDEPLSNLDAKLRVQTRAQIAELQRRLGATTVYVTHDQVEAMTMGDRVAVLLDGVLQQCATPREMYARPANLFVAGFLGSPSMNLVELPVVDGGVRFGTATVPVSRAELGATTSKTVIVGVRPEDLAISDDGLEFHVSVVEELGSDAFAYGHADLTGNGIDEKQTVVARVDWRRPPRNGDRVRLSLVPQHTLHLFDPDTGTRLANSPR